MRANSALQMKFAAKGAYSLQIYTNFMKQPVLILCFPKNSFVFFFFDFVFLGLMGIWGYMGLMGSELFARFLGVKNRMSKHYANSDG